MGSSISIKYTKSQLESFKIATIKMDETAASPEFDLFISHGGKSLESALPTSYKEIFTLPKDTYKTVSEDGTDNAKLNPEMWIEFEKFITVSILNEPYGF